jgi:orotate phosphoribosyltransferase
MTAAKPNPREQLRQLLRSRAIIYGDHHKAIVDRVGHPLNWIFYSWGVTLSHVGSTLTADCLIDALRTFNSTQIAGVGMTGLPLISSIVSRGDGRYTGLYIRDQQEKWGTRRQVEGSGNPDMPVVVIDDCVCSGRSLRRAFAALETAGYTIEGALCLVNFRWKGGTEWVRALGYRMETVFDVWDDLEMYERQDIPSHRAVAAAFDPALRLPEGLSPADAARLSAVHFLNYGLLPTPPESFDHPYDGTGGIAVSFRDRRSDFRVARDGIYHLDSSEADIGRDVLLATAKTLLSSRGAVAKYGLSRLKVGVTLFGEQVPTQYSDLDFDRFGVLIQSKVRPWKIAGALPNTQFFTSEIEQLQHARFTNARLFPQEPFTMYRHMVSKSAESGSSWPTFGVSVKNSVNACEQTGERLTSRAREILRAAYDERTDYGKALPQELFPDKIDGLAVTLYNHGMIGCWTSFQGELDDMIREAAIGAWKDKRWKRADRISPSETDIVVSVFQLAEVLGVVSKQHVAFKLRLGQDSLGVSLEKDSKRSYLLSYISTFNSWSKDETVEGALRKAGFSGSSFHWTTYHTRSWVYQAGRVAELEFGYPRRASTEPTSYREITNLLARYIFDKIGANALPNYCYFPVFDRTIEVESTPRVVLALGALLNAGAVLKDSELREAAISGLRICCNNIIEFQNMPHLNLPGISSATAELFLIDAVYRSAEPSLMKMPAVQRLLAKLQSFFHADGSITWQKQGMRLQSEHDLFPGCALLMAATVAEVDGLEALPTALQACLDWNRRRFHLLHPWGMVFWQTQAWTALYRKTGEQRMASFVFELADWALEHQLDKNGAFLVDYASNGPGFHTACVLEALADAWSLAREIGESKREQDYQRGWLRGMKFVDQLIIHEDDRFAMPKPSRSLGGVRESLVSSTVRIDYVAHTLFALVKGLRSGLIQ